LRLLEHSLLALLLGVLMLDFAVQAVHVTNQSLLLAGRGAMASRLIGAYMCCYSLGSGLGAVAATWVWAMGLGCGVRAGGRHQWPGPGYWVYLWRLGQNEKARSGERACRAVRSELVAQADHVDPRVDVHVDLGLAQPRAVGPSTVALVSMSTYQTAALNSRLSVSM
jgi:hypothetical protein